MPWNEFGDIAEGDVGNIVFAREVGKKSNLGLLSVGSTMAGLGMKRSGSKVSGLGK